MQVYFLGAISGLDKYRNHYEAIVATLIDQGHNVIADHVLDREPGASKNYPIKDDDVYYRLVEFRIQTADLMVVELSHPTINIGYEIFMAIQSELLILVLRDDSLTSRPMPLLTGNPKGRIVSLEYNLDNLSSVVKEGINSVQSIKPQVFSFTITPQIGKYINWVMSHEKMSRSTFIRSLLEAHMRRNKKYARSSAS